MQVDDATVEEFRTIFQEELGRVVSLDEAREIAQPQLPSHFLGRFEIGFIRRVLDRMLARGAARVHVHRDEGFGLVDDDVAA